MPTYDYLCDACGHTFDEFQSMSDKPLKTCPQCKRRKLRRLIGAGAALVFKGPGFYINDYKKDGGAGKKGDAGGSSSDAKSETKSDAKSDSAAKSDTKADATPKGKAAAESKSTPKPPAKDG